MHLHGVIIGVDSLFHFFLSRPPRPFCAVIPWASLTLPRRLVVGQTSMIRENYFSANGIAFHVAASLNFLSLVSISPNSIRPMIDFRHSETQAVLPNGRLASSDRRRLTNSAVRGMIPSTKPLAPRQIREAGSILNEEAFPDGRP